MVVGVVLLQSCVMIVPNRPNYGLGGFYIYPRTQYQYRYNPIRKFFTNPKRLERDKYLPDFEKDRKNK